MKRAQLAALCLLTLAASGAQATGTALTIGGKQLTRTPPMACVQARQPRRELARALRLYDPAQDPREDSSDETPRSKQEIRTIRAALVEHGFYYPNGQESVITWMDFDGDGVCDFTASAGMGGMRSTDRMFLFRGVAKGQFRLADAYHSYMEGSSILVPYLPITIPGEQLPLLVTRQTMLQWQPGRRQFASCDDFARAAVSGKHATVPPLLTALCPHAHAIYRWAAHQLPHNNELSYAAAP
ncbi:MAG TPA: hypothetical protein VGC21_03685 [Telluria sp.]|jgi:hypothetical protein